MFIQTSVGTGATALASRALLFIAALAGCSSINPPREDDATTAASVDALQADDAPRRDDALDADSHAGADAIMVDEDIVAPADLGAPEASIDATMMDVPADVSVDIPPSCMPGQARCADVCAPLATDRSNCGACGNACVIANGTAACVDGTCRVAACNAGFADCDSSAANGCEATLPPATGPFDAHAFWPDADRDGEGDARATPVVGCAAPAGFVANRSDCNDTDAMVSTRAPERCNGVDDNCNTTPDDGCPCVVGAMEQCYGGPAGTNGVGPCRAGTQLCRAGDGGPSSLGACSGQITPAAETCDGVDNNCNGSTDEGFEAISCGVGACRRTVAACVGGRPQSCVPGSATPEVCDNVDNNCNGQVDEGVTRGCYAGPGGTANVGRCRSGTQTCAAGTWSSSCGGQVTPMSESCNNVDDDCDGQTDEGLAQSCVSDTCSGTSTCSRGSWTCSAPRRCPSGFSGSGSSCVGSFSYADSRNWSQGDARSNAEITTIPIPTRAAATGQVEVTLRFSQTGPSCSGQGGCGTSGETNNYVNCDGGSQYNVSAGMFASGSTFTLRCNVGGRVYIGKTVNGQCCCSSCTRAVTLVSVRFTAPSCRY